ncbi:tectonin domain-containing protein [Spirillospora sp. NPDC050679]
MPAGQPQLAGGQGDTARAVSGRSNTLSSIARLAWIILSARRPVSGSATRWPAVGRGLTFPSPRRLTLLGLSRTPFTAGTRAAAAVGLTALMSGGAGVTAVSPAAAAPVTVPGALGAQEWTQLPGQASRVAAAGPSVLWGITPAGAVQRWNGSGWTLVGGSATRLAVGTDDLPWIVRSNNIFRRTSAGQWQQMPGTGVDIAAGGPDNTWKLSGAGAISRWNGTGWTSVAGSASRIAAGSGGEVWIIDPNGAVFRRSSDQWQRRPGTAADIAVADPDRVVITDPDRNAYMWTGSDWQQLPGAQAASAAIGSRYVYAVDSTGTIRRTDS